jgi:hypothetical protein
MARLRGAVLDLAADLLPAALLIVLLAAAPGRIVVTFGL